MEAMDAAFAQGALPDLHVSEWGSVPEPLSAAGAHGTGEEHCAPNGKGDTDTELGDGAPRKKLKKVPKPGMYPDGFSPYVMRPRKVSARAPCA